MKLVFKILPACALLLITLASPGQELILPLGSNPALTNTAQQAVRTTKSLSNQPLELPFFDDFSSGQNWPDTARWSDRQAYINTTYPVEPVSLGVATLDAIDETGAIHANATISPNTFVADSLTSKPINLDLLPSDSIYLSFLYQAGGLGLEPQESDSLCVDFYDPGTQTWNKAWGTPGDTLAPFRQVMIPVTEPRYLENGFRFRFRNIASLPANSDYEDKRGNVDHWHVDYVRLDKNRSVDDTLARDVAISRPLSSMLENMEALPWDHFQEAYNTLFQPFATITYHNNDSAIRNITRYLEITDLTDGNFYEPGSPSAQDILPGNTVSYDINHNYPFDFDQGDTAHFLMKAYLRTDAFDYKINDTVERVQRFRDYFAYDDGSAERAYGLRGQGTRNSLMAVRFNSFIPDELGGVKIYFTQLLDSINTSYYFRFRVWDDAGGVPGTVLYEGEDEYQVMYADSLNRFSHIEFDHPVAVDGPFYVGIMQFNQYMLNVGLDMNNPASGRIFYNLGNEWRSSGAPGSLMIRPFVKRSYSGVDQPQAAGSSVTCYPNPAGDHIRIRLENESNHAPLVVTLTDLAGRTVLSRGIPDRTVPLTGIPPGIYFLTVQQGADRYPAQKIVISR